VRRHTYPLMIFGALFTVLILLRPATAWDRRAFGSHSWNGMRWGSTPPVIFSAPFPYGSRFNYPPGNAYPPGIPFSYSEPGSGATYCLSGYTGVYYLCGYSPDAREIAESSYRMYPASAPFRDQGPPIPSGVLIFRLQKEAEAAVDGVPVGLSAGLGITSVIPGMHRVVVRAPGAETEHTVIVSPHAIFTVTPTAIVPTAP
jgi:hypothetical protein